MNDCSRRQFLRRAAALAAATTLGARLLRAADAQPTSTTATTTSVPTTTPTTGPAAIDRAALVGRHAVTLTAFDPGAAVHVGNGDFAFGADITGLQTFAEQAAAKLPLQTIANWAWAGASVAATLPASVPTTLPATQGTSPDSPRRVSLARLAFVDVNGNPLVPEAVSQLSQTLDLWAGTIRSHFTYRGEATTVTTVAHPSRSLLAVRVESNTLGAGQLAIRLCCDDGGHVTPLETDGNGWRFRRTIEDLTYTVRVRIASAGAHTSTPAGPSAFVLRGQDRWLELTVEFLPDAATPSEALPSFDDVHTAAAAHWQAYWTEGAAIDFSDCTDARAPELERRVVLSQYLTAVHCAGAIPAPPSGLAFNRPAGKAKLDTQWWNAAHFAMWDRAELLERSLAFYQGILPAAREWAALHGYRGARWPRLCGPNGIETLDDTNEFLIWQQPHPIYFAEAMYRANPTRETLDRYGLLVEETARYMATYAKPDASGRYVLGPGLVPAQESFAYDREHVINPTFELAYWAWALGIAQKWRDRVGLPREESWDRVQQKLSKPTVRDGRYVSVENEPYVINGDHPSFLWALGLLPKTHLIDDDVMRETARWTRAKWKWNDAWGVDFASLAQTAARLGEAELAIDSLLMESERNRYSVTGHNHPSDERPIDLAANGALLAAVALMAGGWDGLANADVVAPGFPKNGKWNVRVEGFTKVI